MNFQKHDEFFGAGFASWCHVYIYMYIFPNQTVWTHLGVLTVKSSRMLRSLKRAGVTG